MESQHTVFITGADRGIGFAICQEFLQHGWHVIAGQYMSAWTELTHLQQQNANLDIVPIDVSDANSVQAAVKQTVELTGRLDMLIHVAGIIIREDTPEAVRTMLQVNAVGPMCVTRCFLPLMEGGRKRLCFVSSEAGSISLAHRKNEYGYGVSKAALNMSVRMMFNTLRREGFTFRLYHPGWVNSYMETTQKSTIAPYEPEDTARTAYRAFTEDRRCEDVLVMTDINEQTWSF
ncbi:MAG: SDR family NAD(P)-dependent oxidoreductase [Lachnospiraceae bacterium]|nr:SDR family NAD(P)-dependent oxidoreductase [Lachnospiraceae bacterium]